MPFIRVSPYLGDKTARHIKTEHITAVIGPIETENFIGPGKTRKTYNVEIQVLGNVTHTTFCPTFEAAAALMQLALSEEFAVVQTNQVKYNSIRWETPAESNNHDSRTQK